MFTYHFNFVILIALNIFYYVASVQGLPAFQFDPIVLNKFELDTIHSITASEFLDFTKWGIEANKQERSLETNLVASNILVRNGTISHVQFLDNMPSSEAQRHCELADEILKSSLYIYNAKCAPQGISGEHCASMLTDMAIPKGSEQAEKCESVLKHRNNEHYPLRRLLPRHYKDGFYKMFSDSLPQPLVISQMFRENSKKDSKELLDIYQRNLAVVQWSQFVANDLNKPVVTTMGDGSPIECCNIDNNKLSPRHYHPACEPLVSKDFVNHHGADTCLNYVRSALAIGDKCTFAVPEQINQCTAKLDLSQLYGSDKKSQYRMRLNKNGFLKSTRSGTLQDSLLPMAAENSTWFCALSEEDQMNSTCFMAGDSRVNSNPFAIIIHTIMMRNHNHIATVLNLKHPDWQDDQLFQKAKSINLDIYRRIVFNEWLPIILGISMVNDIKREKEIRIDFESYPQTSNEYAVAASRFYLSMMPNELLNAVTNIGSESCKDERSNKIDNRIFILSDELYSPSVEYASNKFDQVLYSLLMQQAMKLDGSYVESLIPDLSNNKLLTHSDLLAFDIQRGRDHGLQPYFKYLEICNNIIINDWKDFERYIMTKDLNKLRNIYSSWRDIDLIVGGISERAVRNAIVGPTLQCIIGEQFWKLHHSDPSEMDASDLDFSEWKSVTAADILCINSNLEQVPFNIFQTFSKTNPMVNCSERFKRQL